MGLTVYLIIYAYNLKTGEVRVRVYPPPFTHIEKQIVTNCHQCLHPAPRMAATNQLTNFPRRNNLSPYSSDIRNELAVEILLDENLLTLKHDNITLLITFQLIVLSLAGPNRFF